MSPFTPRLKYRLCRPALFQVVWLVAGIFAALWALAGPAPAQVGEAYINLTEVKVTEFYDGILIQIKADGSFDFDRDEMAWVADGSARIEPSGYIEFYMPGHRFSWWIPNARSKIPSDIIRIGKYPVSHIEIKPGAPSDQTWFQGEYALRISIETYADMWPWWYEDEKGYFTWWSSDNRRSVYIAFLADRALDLPAPAEKEEKFEKDAPRELRVEGDAGRVSIVAHNASLQQVAAEISRVTRQTVTADPAARRRLTLALYDQTPQSLLETLGRAYGLAVLETGRGPHLADAAGASFAGYMHGATLARPLHYIKARAARLLLPNFLLPYAQVDERNNALLVAGPPPLLEKVAAELEVIDTPAPQVLVETLAVEFISTEEAARALDWGRFAPGVNLEIFGETGDILFSDLGALPDEFFVALRALESRSRARLRSQQRVAVLSGEEAEIFVGQNRPIVLESYGEGYLEEVKIGTRLEVTPLAGAGDAIRLRLEPEVSTLSEVDAASRLPVVAKRSARSTMLVADGDTVAIAGLDFAQASQSTRKIPLLGDLPGVGELFHAHQKSRRNTETVIFVTARKITGENAAPPESLTGDLP